MSEPNRRFRLNMSLYRKSNTTHWGARSYEWLKASLTFLIMAFVTTGYAGTVTYIYTDPQGTPLAEADAQGNVTSTFEYKPYGIQVLGVASAKIGYTGHVNDPETSLVYMQARYYDPVIGRFISVDAIKSNLNKYAYANNSPMVFIDPDGNDADCSADCIKMRRVSDNFSLGNSYFSSLVTPMLTFSKDVGEVGKAWQDNQRQIVADLAFAGRYFSKGAKFKVERDSKNRGDAMNFNGGPIRVNPGILGDQFSEAQMAGVLGHELYHVSDFLFGRMVFGGGSAGVSSRSMSEVNAYRWNMVAAPHYEMDDSYFIDQIKLQIERYRPCAEDVNACGLPN